MSTTLPDIDRIRAVFQHEMDSLTACVDVALEIHKSRNAGRLCVHCGELAEDHGNFTDLCPYPHETKFEALRCQFEIPLDRDGLVVEVCGARTVPGEVFCQGHVDESV